MSYAEKTTLGYANQATACLDEPARRAFSDIRGQIKAGASAADATLSALSETMQRLGISSMYGCAIAGDATPPPPAGEIDATQREVQSLVASLCEIRGLVETLAERL